MTVEIHRRFRVTVRDPGALLTRGKFNPIKRRDRSVVRRKYAMDSDVNAVEFYEARFQMGRR